MMVPGGSRENKTQASKATLLDAVGVAALAAALAAAGPLAPAAAQDGQVREAWKDAPLVLAQEGAQTPPRQQRFDISSQPLASALTSFGRQSGLQISVDGALVRDLDTAGISGTMTPRQALAQLLAGTGLTFRFTAPDTVMLLGARTADGDGPIRTGPVMVQARADADPSDQPFATPGSSAYISRERIERIQPSSPGDIFKEVPGVLSGASHDGTSINVNIRSAQGLNRVRTMVEGTQQESSGYQGYAGADQRTYIDPELIGGVEITKGPGGGPYGTGTTAGAVNIRLLDADDLIRPGRDFGIRVRGGLGGSAVAPRFLAPEDSFNNNRDADTGLLRDSNDILNEDNWFYSLAGAFRTDRFDLTAAYTRRKEGNYFAGQNGPETFLAFREGDQVSEPDDFRFSPLDPGEEVPNTSEDTESVLLKGTLHLGGGHALEAGYTRYDSRFGQVFPSSINLWAPQQFDLNEVESNRYWLRYKWESENDLIDLQANVWRTTADEQGEIRQGPQENEAWGAELWNTSFVETPLGGLTLTYGGEYTTSKAVVAAQTLINNTVCVSGQGCSNVTQTFSPSVDSSREVFGGYVNAVLTPTDWLTLNAGIRYDGFNAKGIGPTELCTVDFGILARARAARDELVREPEERLRAFENQVLADYLAGAITLEEAIFLANFSPEVTALRQALDEAFAAGDTLVEEARLSLDGFCGTTFVDYENKDDRFSPRVGIAVEPINGVQLFVQYSQGFRALSLVEMGQTFNSPVIINPDLEAEVVKTWEVGVNVLRDGLLFEGDAFRAKLVYFNNDYDNFIARSGQVGSRFFFENVPGVTVSGYEVSLFYDARRVFADLNINVFDKPLDIPTQASIEQPEYAGTLTVGTRWLDENLVLGGRLNFFGEPNLDKPLEVGVVSNYWAANEIVDLFGSYAFNDNVALGFSVENLTNRFYTAPLFVSRIPAPGRTARVHVAVAF